MHTNYFLHDAAYQRKRQDSTYAGWGKHDQLAEDLQLTWQPLRERNAFPKAGKLLDLGCGAGHVSLYFAQLGYETTGIDISPTAIEWAIANAANAGIAAQFIQGDVVTLADVANESFDIALDGRCFHCIIGGDRLQFLRSIYRILKPGGVLTICSMCNDVPNTPHFQGAFDPQSRCLMQGDIAIRYIGDSNEILQEVMAANFRILSAEVVPPEDAEECADLQLIAMKL